MYPPLREKDLFFKELVRADSKTRVRVFCPAEMTGGERACDRTVGKWHCRSGRCQPQAGLWFTGHACLEPFPSSNEEEGTEGQVGEAE